MYCIGEKDTKNYVLKAVALGSKQSIRKEAWKEINLLTGSLYHWTLPYLWIADIPGLQSDLEVSDFLEALGQMFSVFIIDKLKEISPR